MIFTALSRGATRSLLLSLSLSLALAASSRAALAQDAGASSGASLDGGASAADADVGADAGSREDPSREGGAPEGADGGSDPRAQSEDPTAARLRRAQLPQPFGDEAQDLPAGTLMVRVLDEQGQALPECVVRVGSMRDGERAAAIERRTGIDGLARFEGLERGSRVAYRVSTEYMGAKYAADPFQLPTNHGYQVQLVRLPVRSEPNSVLVTEARVELGFQDDRIVVVQRFNIVNISTLGMDGEPRPYTWVPQNGLEFSLPRGYSAFRTDEQGMGMSDLHVEERGGRVRVTGSVQPTTDPRNPVRLVWQSRVKFDQGEVPIELSFPSLPVLAATIVAQAPAGMTLEVEGMPAAEERSANGQRILITGRQRASRNDPNIEGLRIRLRNIPSTHGPERDASAAVAIALALGSLAAGFRRARAGQKSRAEQQRERRESDLRAERGRLVEEIRTLAREHARGDVGPETYRRQRHELASALAAIDRALAAQSQTGEAAPKASGEAA